MKKTALVTICILSGIAMLFLSGCSSAQSSSSQPMMELVIPKATTELTSQPSSPTINEDNLLTVYLLEDVNISDGMRIELRNNSSSTKIFETTEVAVEEGLSFEANVRFEQAGENEVYLHFNVDNTHMMQKKIIEVLP